MIIDDMGPAARRLFTLPPRHGRELSPTRARYDADARNVCELLQHFRTYRCHAEDHFHIYDSVFFARLRRGYSLT